MSVTRNLVAIDGGKAPHRAPAVCPRCGRPVVDEERAVTRAWRRTRRVAADGLALVILAVYGAFSGGIAYLFAHVPREAGWLLSLTTTVLILLMFLALIVRGLLDRWRDFPCQKAGEVAR